MTLGAALMVALFAQTVAAAPGATITEVRLDVRASGECTSSDDLAARIASRSAHIRIADRARIAVRVSVSALRAGGLSAEVVFATDGVDQPPRRVAARSCAELADAAALIIAVTLDPSSGAIETARSVEGETGDQVARVPAPRLPADNPAVARPGSTVPPAPAHHLAFGASFGAQGIAGAGPGVLPGGVLYGMVALDRPGLWAPALLVGATHVWRSNLAESGGAASFTFDGISLDACPMLFRAGAFAARPCASALVGRLATEGAGTRRPAAAVRPFGAVGAALAVSLGSRWQLSARLGAGVTVLRDSYELGSNVFYRAAALTVSGSLAVGVAWR